MSTAESRAFIQRYAEAINGKAQPAALVNQYVADADEALKQHIADAEAAFPHYVLLVEDLIVEGDKAVLRFNLHGTHQGNFMGIPATGKEFTCRTVAFFLFEDDELVCERVYFDAATILSQLGLVGAAPSLQDSPSGDGDR